MKRICAPATAVLLTVSAANAQVLHEIQNYTVHLGAVSGSVYFERSGPEQRLVATLISGQDATPVRVITTLAAGQSTTVSVPQGPGEPALEVSFTRRGDSVVVEDGGAVVGSIR